MNIKKPKTIQKSVSVDKVNNNKYHKSVSNANHDNILAAQLQKEEMELQEQLFMFEIMEEREHVLQRSGQDNIDPDRMTYEV